MREWSTFFTCTLDAIVSIAPQSSTSSYTYAWEVRASILTYYPYTALTYIHKLTVSMRLGTVEAVSTLITSLNTQAVGISLVPRPSRFSSRIEIIAHNVRGQAGRSGYEASWYSQWINCGDIMRDSC